jgi:hypothetical protein
MSSELLAAAQIDDLMTIVSHWSSGWLPSTAALRLVKTRGAPLPSSLQPIGNCESSSWSLPLLRLEPGEGYFENRVWYLLDCCLNDPSIDDAITTTILRVLVMKDILPVKITRQTLLTRHVKVVQEWARLEARLPAYLTLLNGGPSLASTAH